MRIDKYPQNHFRYTVPGQFQFFLVSTKKRKKEKKTKQTNKLTKRCNSLLLFFFSIEKFFKKNQKLTDVFSLEIFISSHLCAVLNEIYQPEGHLLCGLLMQTIPSKFQDGCMFIKFVIASTDSSFNQFKTSRMH